MLKLFPITDEVRSWFKYASGKDLEPKYIYMTADGMEVYSEGYLAENNIPHSITYDEDLPTRIEVSD